MIGSNLSNFKITAKIGEGGMGEVFRATDSKLDREVAIKVLPESVAGDQERLARFEREARVLASLNHPNIAGIFQVEEADGVHFLVMELAEGETLAQVIAHGPISLERALPMAKQIAEALEAAHDKGIIHRDLKPANVVVNAQGEVKVLDFGLAKALEVDAASGSAPSMSLSPTLTAQMTQAGVLLGTAAYMSPEQARGQAADRRSDLWALGVVIYEMLTADRLFEGSTVSDTLAGVLRADPDWKKLPERTPAPVRRLLRRCLEREARYRLSDASAARLEIEDAISGREDGEVAVVAATDTRTKGVRLMPWLLLVLTTAALAVAIWMPWRNAAPVHTPQPPLKLDVSLSEYPADTTAPGAATILSPAGDRLAYVVVDGEDYKLNVRALDQLDGSMLAQGAGAESPYHPFFSPDGEWLGFVTSGELKKIPYNGGTPISLTKLNRSRGATWTNDDQIIFAPDPGSGLMMMPASGGEPKPLTTLDESKGEASHRWPQILPGGKAVIFTSQTEEAQNFDEANIEAVILGSGERKLLQEAGYYGRYAPGGFLLYINDGTMYARPFDVDALEVSGTPAPVAQEVTSDEGGGGAHYDISNNGTLVYHRGRSVFEEYSILWVDREGNSSPLWTEEGVFFDPSLSPDAKELAVTRIKDDNNDIWVFDLEREVATRLTFDPDNDASPVWMPDGRHILFTSSRNSTPGVYRKRSDGSGEVELLAESESFLSPSSVSAVDIFVLPLEEGSEVEIFLSTPFLEWHPAFSPDGKWIAYMSDESGRYEVYIRPYPATSGGRWQISDHGGGQPRWSADGRTLYYRSDGGIMSATIEPTGDTLRIGRPKEVFDEPYRGGIPGLSSASILGDYDVSGDGQRFVMFPEGTSQGRGAHVTLIFNFDDELERIVH
ncbi:MAG: protein kinase [Acidobacteriota bacterium]